MPCPGALWEAQCCQPASWPAVPSGVRGRPDWRSGECSPVHSGSRPVVAGQRRPVVAGQGKPAGFGQRKPAVASKPVGAGESKPVGAGVSTPVGAGVSKPAGASKPVVACKKQKYILVRYSHHHGSCRL